MRIIKIITVSTISSLVRFIHKLYTHHAIFIVIKYARADYTWQNLSQSFSTLVYYIYNTLYVYTWVDHHSSSTVHTPEGALHEVPHCEECWDQDGCRGHVGGWDAVTLVCITVTTPGCSTKQLELVTLGSLGGTRMAGPGHAGHHS